MTRMASGNNSQFGDAELEVSYAEFGNEDWELAESGLGDHANLERENVVTTRA